MQRIKIQHLTEYHYPVQVQLNQHKLLLRPREGHDVRIETSKLSISPEYKIKWQRDVLGNSVAMVDFLKPTTQLIIASELVIQHYEQTPFDFNLEDYAVFYPFNYALHEQLELSVFQTPIFTNDQYIVNQWLQQFNLQGVETFGLLLQINQAIHQQFRYQMREEPGVQTPSYTLKNQSGSCRDYATLMIEGCRQLGLASRFVSGYLHAPATEIGNATTHAWVEVYLPGTGWKGFDPTSGEVTGSQHIAVAVARDPETVPPVSGSFTSLGSLIPKMVVNVQVNLIT